MSTPPAVEDVSNPPARRRSRRSALKAACLTAGLVTAFGAGPAQADTGSSGLDAVNGGQSTPIFDGYVLNASSPNLVFDTVTPIAVSQTAPSSGNYGIAVFSPKFGSATLSGQSFENAFLPNEGLTEAEVVSYIASDFTDPNLNDQAAYHNFVLSLYNNDYSPANGSAPATPINAFQFSNGQPIGTISPSQFNSGTPSYTGFGLVNAQTAVPEPGSLSLLVLGGAALAGLSVTRRRVR